MTASPLFIHDLKNHLATVLGFAQLLLAQLADDDPRRADVEEICHAARAALDLANDQMKHAADP